ncbi:phospholipid/cholesterol/gamma-HCH transport system substrate-binding protein [Larkinella arboricola]|uniref:Phospholipid/cholesterol/gamma-HCH transport system substrate-binding protein n=1 Tax=Larkinella arboricola TaxID=643671 RepID=A0A327XD96_LARAB|nr:MlaD family protein [Larkinella arboricola]RAK02236.1 phospholipid/cholesterol/gamma-HCH transport system substrate-binding protein [Larkinella arboricola]
MKLSKEAKVGILAVVTLAMLYFGFNFLKGSDIFSRSNKYLVVYDNVDGLTASNPVQLNGLSVGRVDRIEILPTRSNQLLVTLDIDKQIKIGQGSKAVLADAGVLGGKVIILQIKPSNTSLESGDTLVSGKEAGITALIKEKTLPVLNSVDSLTFNLNRIVKQFDRTGLILNKTLEGVEATTGTLQLTVGENRESIRRLMANLSSLSASLAETEKQVKPLLAKANTFADSLNALKLGQTLASANQSIGTLQQMLADINSGKGTLGKLKGDEALYRNVNGATASLEKLLTDFRENPKRYVHFSLFGRKEKKSAATTPAQSATVIVSDSTQ